MSRALWNGTINFGLVSMPVELHTADASQEIDLDMLDKRDNARIQYKRYNARTHREVDYKDIVKGYKTKSGDYVIVTPEDIKKANVRATQTIDIGSFVDLKEVDVAYFEKPYYLKPRKGGEKPYSLLHKTLAETQKAGIGTVVIRTKQHLAAILPRKGGLILEIMRFPDELRSEAEAEIKPVSAKVSAAEVKMAKQLVASMSEDWNPKRYHDTYREDLMKMIQYKIKHGDTEELASEMPDEEAGGGKVVDLMPLLRRSLAGGGKARGKSSPRAKPHAKKKVRRGS